MKKIIMVMGVQRSGTNVLRQSLSIGPGVSGFNEEKDSEVFHNWYLKPEKQLREFLVAQPGAVLLKPISETRIRTVADVFEEYTDYELFVPWAFRDPVNVFHSRMKRWPELTDVPAFIEEWNKRNRIGLAALEEHGDRVAVIRYEDMIADAKVFWDLCRFLGVKGEHLFRKDSYGGYRNLPRETIDRISQETAEVFELLRQARRFKPRDGMEPRLPDDLMAPKAPKPVSDGEFSKLLEQFDGGLTHLEGELKSIASAAEKLAGS